MYRGERLTGILETPAANRSGEQQRLLEQALLSQFASPSERPLWQQLESYRGNPHKARQLAAVGDAAVEPRVPLEELAAWATVISSLMNLDETASRAAIFDSRMSMEALWSQC